MLKANDTRHYMTEDTDIQKIVNECFDCKLLNTATQIILSSTLFCLKKQRMSYDYTNYCLM